MADRLLTTARRVAGAAFEILGELGRSGDERVAYLARETPTGELVALTLEGLPDAEARGTDPHCSVRRALDNSVPASGSACPACGSSTETWARHCSDCRHDLSGGPPPVEDENTGRMLAQTAARGRFELLGDMNRTEGGAPVYFGREQATGGLVALRLEPMDDPEAPVPFTLSVAQQIGSIGADESTLATGAAAIEPEQEKSGRVYVCPLCDAQYPGGTFFCPRDGTALRPKVRTQDLVGQTVAGRYRIVERLGQGGMGQVYKAVHVRMGSHCAIKIMNPALETDPEALGRFAREATLASRIEHANVARVYDFGETEAGLLFLAMEFVEGESLSAIISEEGPLKPARAAELAWQVADALSAAHALGTIHRDIKPDNIIVNTSRSDREVATVVDFGIAKGIEVSEDEQVTRAGFVVGNPKYMSPEQLIGETTDARGDVYSLGCVLYEMLVGKSAFSGATGAALLTQRLTEPAPSPRSEVPSVPKVLDDIVTCALARERDDRYATALDMRDALDEYIETVVTSSRRVRTDRQRAVKPPPAPPAAKSPEIAQPVVDPVAPSPSDLRETLHPKKPSPKKPSPEKPSPEKRSPEKRSPEKRSPEKRSPEKRSPEKRKPPATVKVDGPAVPKPSKPLLAAAAATIVVVLAAIFWPRGGPDPALGTLAIQGTLPDGAAITARDDQGNVTTIDGVSVQLAAGPYRLSFEAPGHESDQARVVIESDGSTEWRPRVVPIQIAAADDTAQEGGTGGQGAGAGGGGPPPALTWSAARADSVEAMLRSARSRTASGQFTQATRLVDQADARVRQLHTAFPGQAALGGLERQVRQVRDSVALLQRTVTVAPQFRRSSADSIESLIAGARTRVERREYANALSILNQAGTRVSRLRSTFPNEAALTGLDRRIRALRDSVNLLQQPQAPVFRPSSADSINGLLMAAEVRAERKEYPEAFAFLNQASSRLAALRSTFPNEAALTTLGRAVEETTTRTRTTCEAWRQIQLERGLPAPVCR